MIDIMNEEESVRFKLLSREERDKWFKLISISSKNNSRKKSSRSINESYESSHGQSRRLDFIDKNLQNSRLPQKQLSRAKEKHYLSPNNRMDRRRNSPRYESSYDDNNSRHYDDNNRHYDDNSSTIKMTSKDFANKNMFDGKSII